MIKCNFKNNINEEVYYLKWEVNDAKANVVISHGMVEHPARYDDLAKYLNSNGINVYGIYHIGHGEHAKVLNHMGEGEFDRCISNINELVELVKVNNLPTFLLGHSMAHLCLNFI
jgi:alpha-beta hydrolase superfamily lysophospholipase